MVLSLKKHFPDHPPFHGDQTGFMEKMWISMVGTNNDPNWDMVESYHLFRGQLIAEGFEEYYYLANKDNVGKIHSVRKSGRWLAGKDIQPAVNVRTANYFQFMPTMRCRAVQDVIIWTDDDGLRVCIDGRMLNNDEIFEFSKCDGFDSTVQMAAFFGTYFRGDLIHWTDKRY